MKKKKSTELFRFMTVTPTRPFKIEANKMLVPGLFIGSLRVLVFINTWFDWYEVLRLTSA